MGETVYIRKISAEEAREGYVMILKDRLRLFPPVDEPFMLRDGDQQREVSIEAEHCECRGPAEPHEHYRLSLPGLVKGSSISIRQSDEGYQAVRS